MPPHRNGLLADQYPTRTTQHKNNLSVSQSRTKGPTAAPREQVKQLWRPTNTTPTDTQLQVHAWYL
ncbi:hypothetical protein Taro_024229 [Colocasia esculenta]|uniref:Uncharacterized protein n=1 Tax=Colocasia esculenta TaxID=4460 RepID=A0A843V6W7_COLES|nr:hypothetical protein [Colocasia esculenta]